MLEFDELYNRIKDIKKILNLENDNVQIRIIPDEFCYKKPWVDYKAVYQKENNTVFVHPDSFKNNSLIEMTMFLAHELYHAYQNKNEPALFDSEINQNYSIVGLDYVKQPLEKQAYAFQIAIAMLYDEAYYSLELDGVDDSVLSEINNLAEDYYEKYKEKFIEIVIKH